MAQRFYRVAPNGVEGSGLELAIAQKILRHHDATLELVSPVADGRRTCAHFAATGCYCRSRDIAVRARRVRWLALMVALLAGYWLLPILGRVPFVTVQIQSASPPAEVVTAIKDRMVAAQRQEQAEAEAAQRRTLADAEFYAAQKTADGDAYEITMLAAAEAERIALTSEAQQIAVRAMLEELERRGDLAQAYIQLLIAQELKQNSKWIISGGQGGEGIVPRIEVPETP